MRDPLFDTASLAARWGAASLFTAVARVNFSYMSAPTPSAVLFTTVSASSGCVTPISTSYGGVLPRRSAADGRTCPTWTTLFCSSFSTLSCSLFAALLCVWPPTSLRVYGVCSSHRCCFTAAVAWVSLHFRIHPASRCSRTRRTLASPSGIAHGQSASAADFRGPRHAVAATAGRRRSDSHPEAAGGGGCVVCHCGRHRTGKSSVRPENNTRVSGICAGARLRRRHNGCAVACTQPCFICRGSPDWCACACACVCASARTGVCAQPQHRVRAAADGHDESTSPFTPSHPSPSLPSPPSLPHASDGP